MTNQLEIPWHEKYKVNIPEGQLNSVKVKKFTLTKERCAFQFVYRAPLPGNFTALYIDGELWMSDTIAEIRDHLPVIDMINKTQRCNILIHGLGIGVVLQAAIWGNANSIDVVEINRNVIDLIGPYYLDLADKHGVKLNIHHDNAYTKKWERNSKWDIVWHDIWVSISPDNLSEMTKLKRSFCRRTKWQGCWAEFDCKRVKRSWRQQW